MGVSNEQSIQFIGKKHISEMTAVVLNILTFGLFFIFCKVFSRLEVMLKTSSCPLSEANCVVLKDQYGNSQIVHLKKIKVKNTLVLSRYVKNGLFTVLDSPYGRFIYDYKLDKFVTPVYSHTSKKTFDELYHEYMLKSREEERTANYEKMVIFGENHLGVKIPSVKAIILDQLLSPLFIWEVISLVIWISVDYIIYASVVGVIFFTMFFVDLFSELRQRKQLLQNLKISKVRVLRDGAFRLISEYDILPGDILYIDKTSNFTCDVEIVKGDVITDESFLTGESIPICKGIGSIIYSGTKIIKSTSTSISLNNVRMEKLVKVKNLTKNPSDVVIEQVASEDKFEDSAIGIVIKTGKRTKRGLLFKNLAIKKPSSNEFTVQSLRVISYLIALSFSLLGSFMLYLSFRQVPYKRVIKYSFDLALTFFSPALYTCLSLGTQFARGQLQKEKINTTDVTRINTAGEVDLVIFDKTGTLTKLDVDILCFDSIDKSETDISRVNDYARMALSTCHYVVELDNQYSGDILDMKMFLFSQSKIFNKDGVRYIEMEVKSKYEAICKEYTGKEDDCTLFFNADTSNSSNGDLCPEDILEVLKIYDFDLYLKRISVVVKDNEGKKYLFCKGAPDSLKKILNNIPSCYAEKVRNYGLEGYRVLTVAYKEFTGELTNRENDEKDLNFLGFLIFANKLKDETIDVISELKEANLNPKMCTGDNILTAISVAKECGMIDNTVPVLFPVLEDSCKSCYDVEWYCVADEDYIFDKVKMQLYYEKNRSTTSDFVVAVEGKEFEYFKSSNYHQFILDKGIVFARFNPENKKDLIEEYSKAGFVTMFCGDGANDTGALCSADVGLSLATNEASLAASFNSVNLSSVLDLIKEGRSALSMSAAQFKYIFYSQVLAGFQMLSLLPCLYFPSDGMSLINDLMSCYVLAYALSNFKRAKKIHPKKINIDLGSDAYYLFLELLCTLVIFFFTSLSIQSIASLKLLKNVSTVSKNSGVIFISTMILLVYRSIKFANFGPHRQNYKTNKLFLSVLAFCFCVSGFVIFLLVLPSTAALKAFSTMKLADSDKKKAFACLLLSLSVTVVFDLLEKRRISALNKN